MIRNQRLLVFFLCFHLLISAFEAVEDVNEEEKPYIVYMGDAVATAQVQAAEHHHNLLMKVIKDENKARKAKIYSYGKSINGFVAKLRPDQAMRLSREEGVISVFKNTKRELHTTRSWDFLGMVQSKYKRNVAVESNIIVGVLDTGIFVDSPSFNDKGIGPPPARWKGECKTGPNFTRCNNKVIGARSFNVEKVDHEKTAVDYEGHGTHTSSTAAGVSVPGASLFGIANGTARGGVPAARIAMYKVCWEDGCSDMDILAGLDQAIYDKVDIISISIGAGELPYFEDVIAIGAFAAMKRGILTSCSGGNKGPNLFTIVNTAPWIMTVASNSIDRNFKTLVQLGNGHNTLGISLNGFSPKKRMYPLTSGLLASNVSSDRSDEPSICVPGTMDKKKVEGKIVYCEADSSSGQDQVVGSLRGAGVISQLLPDEPNDAASVTLIPGSYVLFKEGTKISHYINSTKNPKAVIFKTKTIKMLAPSISSFSSRGPQLITLNILKPDLSAPGLNILAGYSKLASVSGYPEDKRQTLYTIMSGTSMACPHATAAAAYVKSFHPGWSPAAIKSALMTTATPMRIQNQDGELGAGSGQINPKKAIHPGLIYDINTSSYIKFLCKEGYNNTAIKLIVGSEEKFNCSNLKRALGTDGLNYPTMHKQIIMKSTTTKASKVSAVFYRTVTNVGHPQSIYVAKIWAQKGLKVEVKPTVLKFKRRGQKRNFKVVVKGVLMMKKEEKLRFVKDKKIAIVVSASLTWDDSRGHLVRSPIVLFASQGL